MGMRTYPVVGFGISAEDLYDSFTPEKREALEEGKVDMDWLAGGFDRRFLDDTIDYDGNTYEGSFYLLSPNFPWDCGPARTKEDCIKTAFDDLQDDGYFPEGYTFAEFMKLPWSVVTGTCTS